MSETLAAPAQGNAPKVETPQRVGFWRSVVTGPGGLPDELCLIFLMVQVLIFIGVSVNTVFDRHFPLEAFVGSETGLLTLYGTQIGIRGRLSNQ